MSAFFCRDEYYDRHGFGSADEARAAALAAIERCRKDARDEWPEYTLDIRWGAVVDGVDVVREAARFRVLHEHGPACDPGEPAEDEDIDECLEGWDLRNDFADAVLQAVGSDEDAP